MIKYPIFFIDNKRVLTLNKTALHWIFTAHCISHALGVRCFRCPLSDFQLPDLTSAISTGPSIEISATTVALPAALWLAPRRSRHSCSGPHRAQPPAVLTGYYSQCLANQIECSGEPCVFARAVWKSGTSRRRMDFAHFSREFTNRIEMHVGKQWGSQRKRNMLQIKQTCFYILLGLGADWDESEERLQGREKEGCVLTTH